MVCNLIRVLYCYSNDIIIWLKHNSIAIDCCISIGVMTKYGLYSSDSLPVGQYGVVLREVETGGKGYGRFDITSCEYMPWQ